MGLTRGRRGGVEGYNTYTVRLALDLSSRLGCLVGYMKSRVGIYHVKVVSVMAWVDLLRPVRSGAFSSVSPKISGDL
jgi:hypothetical protein